jgi:NTE family protein
MKRARRRVPRALLLSLAVWTPIVAADINQCVRAPVTDRPTIGLVLGGGGARGAAHIGVLQVLQEMHIPVDYVAGTSMGSLVGGLLATGMDANQLQATIESIDFSDLFKDSVARQDEPYRRKRDDDLALYGPKLGIGKNSQLLPAGAIHGQKILYLFETLTSERVQVTNFDNLPIPYRAVATDIVTGKPVVMGDGDLASAMRSSMSVPGVFDPVERGNALLVDGGIADNVPIDVMRRMGADIIIAVDVGTPLSSRDQLKTVFDITGQLSGLLVVRNTQAQLETLTDKDILITPPLGDEITSGSFDLADKAIPIGRDAAAAKRDRLARLSISPDAYAAYRAQLLTCTSTPPPIMFVKLDNQSRFDDSVIENRIHVRVGQPLDLERMKRTIDQIYALGFIDLASYKLVEQDGETGVEISVTQDSRGTQFIEWGGDIFGNDNGSSINVRIGYLNTGVDKYGSELRVLTEFGETPGFAADLYKAFNPPLRMILLPKVWFVRDHINTYEDKGRQSGAYHVDEWGGQFAVAREFGRSAALGVGVRRYSGNATLEVGDQGLSGGDFNGAEYFVNFQHDRLDSRYFPSFGSQFVVTYQSSEPDIGADAYFEQVLSNGLTTWTRGPHTLLGGFRFNTTLHNDAPTYALYRIGGLFNLSGLQKDQLVGQNAGVLLGSYRYHFGRQGGLFPAYGGFSVEYGNTADHASDVFDDGIWNGSLYFGYQSPVGPLYWGVGFAEHDQHTYFLRLGNIFGRTRIGR